jgi:hypothetical protein
MAAISRFWRAWMRMLLCIAPSVGESLPQFGGGES